MVNNSININKTKEGLISDGQQFHQYQQNKRKFNQWWSTTPSISTKQKKDFRGVVDHHWLNFLLFCWYWWNCWPSLIKLSFVLLIFVDKTKESLISDGQQLHEYIQNKRKFNQWWSTIPPISTKQKKI
jgi:phage anti-repressor protein